MQNSPDLRVRGALASDPTEIATGSKGKNLLSLHKLTF